MKTEMIFLGSFPSAGGTTGRVLVTVTDKSDLAVVGVSLSVSVVGEGEVAPESGITDAFGGAVFDHSVPPGSSGGTLRIDDVSVPGCTFDDEFSATRLTWP